MRTKALLSVAAIAASAITAMAQGNVYSLNIVGYATVYHSFWLQLVGKSSECRSNQRRERDHAHHQRRTHSDVDRHAVHPDRLRFWFGGWVGADGSTAPHLPSLPPGQGFFFFNPVAATNVTFVGQVVPNPGATNQIPLAAGYNLVGSAIPATVTAITNAPVSLP
jgi:hypothetical protein